MYSSILSSLVTRVPTFMATQFLFLPLLQLCKILEGPPSILGSPLSFPLMQTCISSMHSINVLSYEHFHSQSFLMGQCIHDTFVHEFLARILIILGCQGSYLSSFRFFFLNLTLLGYQWHTTTIQNHFHIIKIIKYFRRDSYPIPFKPYAT
jgi:hypothetical protein